MTKHCMGSSLILIAIVVVLARCIVFLAYTSPVDLYGRPPVPDRWLEIARNILDGHGYALSTYELSDTPRPTALRGPTVVYLFVAALWLMGDHLWSILIAQWLLDVGTAFVLFFIALDIFHDRRVGFIASLGFACYVPAFLFSFGAWSEPLATLFLASFTLSLLRALNRPASWRFILCGILLGLTTLTKPLMQFYPLVVLPLLIWRLDWHWQRVLASFVVLGVAFAAIMAPWVVRNYYLFHAFILGVNQTGLPLYESNFTLGNPGYLRLNSAQASSLSLRQKLESQFGQAPDNPDLWSYAKVKGINEFELDQIALQKAKKVILTFPGRYAILSSLRILRFWFHHRFVESIMRGRLSLDPFLIAAANAVLLGLSIIGLLFFRGVWLSSAVPLIVLVAYHTILYSLTHAIVRYNAPVMPYVILLASHTIVRLFATETPLGPVRSSREDSSSV